MILTTHNFELNKQKKMDVWTDVALSGSLCMLLIMEEQNMYLYVFVTNDYVISTENRSVREEGFQLIRSFLNKMYVVVSKLPV